MNTNDVERRLEALAAASASPDAPHAIIDRMLELEAGLSVPGPASSTRLRAFPRPGGSRSRALTLLGVAAIIAVLGGVLAASGGGLPKETRLALTASDSTRPSVVLTAAPSVAPSLSPVTSALVNATAPKGLGSWRKVYTFDGNWGFGHIWGGGPYQPIWLSWQNGEIVGYATRYRGDEQNICLLRSHDGTNWTCADLPEPTAMSCGVGPCADLAGLAVRNGRWVLVGSSSLRPPSEGSTVTSAQALIWTSNDGASWSAPARAPTPPGFVPGVQVVGGAAPQAVEATKSGFVMAGCSWQSSATSTTDLWTSADGTGWKPARYAPGSARMICPNLGSATAAGVSASGQCPDGAGGHFACVGFSADGLTWTTSNPASSSSAGTADNRLAFTTVVGPTYVNGQWVVLLNDPQAGASYYEAVSTDCIHWTASVAPVPNGLAANSTNESDYHPAVITQLASAGYWAMNDGPLATYDGSKPSPGYTLTPAGGKTYWSATAANWLTVSDGPPGWAIGLVETPTSLVAVMAQHNETQGAVTETYSVWVADRL